jgi:hypothetical protein
MNFNRDADNHLSLERLKSNYYDNHLNKNKSSYPLFSTRTGWHCRSKKWRNSDITELGVGISIYFKFLKFMMCLFAWFTFLSLPAYFFYFNGSESHKITNSFQYVLSAFTLGNLG